MPTTVGILTFMNRINFTLSAVEHENKFYHPRGQVCSMCGPIKYWFMFSDQQVANVEFRENEFQRDRETKSAFYYGNKDGEIDQVDSSDAKTTNKNAVLQQVSRRECLTNELI